MATKLTHPKEWKHFLLLCEWQEFDNPLFGYYQKMFFTGPKMKEKTVELRGTTKPVKVTKPDGSTEIHMGRKKLADKLEIYPNFITQQNGKVIQKGKLKGWRFDVLPKPTPIYALYDEDELLGIGTPEELSKEHDITLATLEFYLYQQSRPYTKKHVIIVDWKFEGED